SFTFTIHSSAPPDDPAHLLGPLGELHVWKSADAAPVRCSGWFGRATIHGRGTYEPKKYWAAIIVTPPSTPTQPPRHMCRIRVACSSPPKCWRRYSSLTLKCKTEKPIPITTMSAPST